MPPGPPEDRSGEPTSSSRIGCILLLLVLLGVPAFVVSGLFVRTPLEPVVSGDQPGGLLNGTVVDGEGRAIEGATVRLTLVGTPAEPGGPRATRVHARATTDVTGAFQLVAPPFDGHYVVSAEGELWVQGSRTISLVDPKGTPREPGELRLVLEPGCLLRVELVDADDGTALGDGEWNLDGSSASGPLFGFPRRTWSFSGPVYAGRIERGALPAMSGTLYLRLDDGKRAELPLDLAPGTIERTVRL